MKYITREIKVKKISSITTVEKIEEATGTKSYSLRENEIFYITSGSPNKEAIKKYGEFTKVTNIEQINEKRRLPIESFIKYSELIKE